MSEKPKKPNVKLYLLSAVAIILIFGLYRVVVMLAENEYIPIFWLEVMMWAYMIVGCALFLAAFILRRGFSGKPLTEDDIPDTVGEAEKLAILSSDKRRKKIAKYLMIPLVAIIFVFMYEIIELYYFPVIKSWFSSL